MTPIQIRKEKLTEDKIFVALDRPDRASAERIVSSLAGTSVGFKVGLELFTACGPELVRWLCDAGHRVFLDLKFHDIPNTVAGAVVSAAQTGAWMINVHALGGREMMMRAGESLRNECERKGIKTPKLIAVTVLTSSDNETLRSIGIDSSIDEMVIRLTRSAFEAGLDGVVASANEAALIRREMPERFLIVTPGIRPSGATLDDQKRVMTPQDAIDSGSDILVIGRPITAADDPQKALRSILES